MQEQQEGVGARINRLSRSGRIPREIAALMRAVAEMRNASEYQGKQPLRSEGAEHLSNEDAGRGSSSPAVRSVPESAATIEHARPRRRVASGLPTPTDTMVRASEWRRGCQLKT